MGGARAAVGACTRGLIEFRTFIVVFKFDDFVLVGVGSFWILCVERKIKLDVTMESSAPLNFGRGRFFSVPMNI